MKVTLKKALVGRNKKQVAVAASLGLRRVGDVTIQPDNAPTAGKIAKIAFLLDVEKA
ncbi:50S ribosomal protein L30 [Ruminococcaceae bacterium OttesenSCG-928-O06]|nr:50S ribosomal protein L30 [Ruminococcaceae bacterium OttesenSCG-928-O06]